MTAPKARWGPPSLLLISQLALLCVLALPRETRTQENAANQIVDPALFQDLGFRMVGPTRGGRSTTVAGHPDHPHTFYAGFTGGGVWKTGDAGISWVPVSDGFLETGSIGAIRVAPSNAQII
jgi:hypothetical protein